MQGVLLADAAQLEEESAMLLTMRECLASLMNLRVSLAVQSFCLKLIVFVVNDCGYGW